MRAVRQTLAAAAVLVFCDGAQATAAAHRAAELRYIPREAALVLVFERTHDASREIAARLRDELLFASGLDEELAGVSAALDKLDVDRVVAGATAAPEGKAVAVVLHGSFERAALSALLAGGEGSQYSHAGVELRVAREGDRALAFIDARTIAFGARAAVERCLDAARRGDNVLGSPELRRFLDQVSPQAQVWGLQLASWLGFREPAPSEPAFRGFRDALAGIRWAGFSANVAPEVATFRTLTQAGSADDAVLLADSVRAFLAPLRSNRQGFAPILKALEHASVARDGANVSLELPLSGEALSRLKRSADGRKLVSWRLGPEEREGRQRVGEIFAAMGVTAGARVADVGAGSGFFTVALARAVGASGRVFAVEISERLVDELKQRAAAAPFPQIEAVLGAVDDPRLLPESLDAALIVNSYHEMPQHRAMLAALFRSLKPGGRLVLVEPFSPARRAEPRAAQEKNHLIAPEIVAADLCAAGFELVRTLEEFAAGPQASHFDSLVVGRRPVAVASGAR
jgi:predicted methyltransferase